MLLKITNVQKGSLGEEIGFEKGDCLVAFDNNQIVDILDYMYYDAQTVFSMKVLAKSGNTITLDINKDEDESFGFTFEDDGLQIRTCRNDCLFCFVRQMPKGMRESLYVKDDDYRQSFLCGNFVTLTNVTDEEIERIIRLKLSPLYVSVQTTNGELRKKMLNNRFADKIVSQLERLSAGGINIHAQVVLVKGLNDGVELENTLNTLYSIKGVQSVAVVPCGITKFRDGLYPIDDIDGEYALGVINQVNSLNEKHKSNLVALADEFYFKAGVSFPPYESYGDFWQIENGVGMSAKFERDIKEIIEFNEKPLLEPGHYITICGTSVYNFMSKIIKMVENACEGVEIKLVAVENDFFGHTVNCTGLLTGGDIVKALKQYAGKYDALLVPNPCLMQFADLFLDGMNFEQLESELKMKIVRARVN